MIEVTEADRDAAKAAVFAVSLPEAFATHRIQAAKAAEAENARLREDIAEIIAFAETRRQDGIEMGAAVWRIALEDIIKDARKALEQQP